MGEIYFISDMHLFHKNCLGFKRPDSSPMRPEFQPKDPNDAREVSRCLANMNQTIIDNCNKAIGPSDKLYNLGDVSFFLGNDFVKMYKQINTQQHRLLIGNHDDPIKLTATGLFKKMGIWRVFKDFDFTATHLPLKQDSNKLQFNLHGHTHDKKVLNDDGTENLRYINICVENTNYSPVHIDSIVQIIKQRKQQLGLV